MRMINMDKIAITPPRTVIKPGINPPFNVLAIIRDTVMPGVIAIKIHEMIKPANEKDIVIGKTSYENIQED